MCIGTKFAMADDRVGVGLLKMSERDTGVGINVDGVLDEMR